MALFSLQFKEGIKKKRNTILNFASIVVT